MTVTQHIARLLFPFALVVAAALLAKGYALVGDGFSAGAVAGLGAVVQLIVQDREQARRVVGARYTRALVGLGLVIVLAVVLAPVLFGYPPVTHFPRAGAPVTKLGVVDVHTAILFDAGTALLVYGAIVAVFARMLPHFEGAAR